MSLILTILNKPNPGQEISSAFQTEGTIGRAPDNAWVLVDPERFTSSHHAKITSSNGEYFVTDTSTNGVFVNGSMTPLGKGNTTKLSHGDKLKIGQYEISVTVQAGAPLPLGDPDSSPFGQPTGPAGTSPFDASPISSGELGRVSDTNSLDIGGDTPLDPLAILNAAPSSQASPFPATPSTPGSIDDLGLGDLSSPITSPFDAPTGNTPSSFGTMGDNASPLQQQFEPPVPSQPPIPEATPATSGGGSFIPDDWDFGSKQAPTQQPSAPIPPFQEQEPSPSPANQSSIPDITPPPAISTQPGAPTSIDDLLGMPPSHASAPTTPDTPYVSPFDAATPDTQPEMPAQNIPTPQPSMQGNPFADATPPAPPQPTTPQTPIQPPISGAGAGSPPAIQNLLKGMSLEHLKLTPEEENDLAFEVGQLVHSSVEGLVKVLRARASIKSEFRMSVTTIQAKENNPLKFSPTGRDALNHMFSPGSSSYMSAIEAVNEGFDDMEAHMIAMMAGMQNALHNVLKRFDPIALEREFEHREGKRGFSFTNKKAKHWDVYNTHYKEIIASVEDDFHTLFGDEFSRAYEEQVAKLKSSH